ncbi:MAG: chorismate-binding protein [Spirochaetales bacterium]|nr:chorismate-binding protein [Spirochaetales bacterium]
MKTHLIKRLPGERYTPCGLARKLNAKIILESSSLTKGKERFSILLVKEIFTIEQRGGEVFLKEPAGKTKKVNHKGTDILPVLSYFADKHGEHNYEFPYPAGGVGFLSFEFCKYCDDINIENRKDPLNLPEAAFIFGSTFIIFDHYTDEIIILVLNYPGYELDLEKELSTVEESLADLNFNYLMEKQDEAKATLLTSKEKDEEYKDAVRTVREEIIKGNLLQAVPSRRLTIKTKKTAMEAYRSLRNSNPSPYQFYLDFGEYQLYGASPEVHVKVKRDKVTIRPIAGTRKRGKHIGEDIALAEELLSDEKERAEHLMLIDLARNDLGRVCTVGSVEVTEKMIIEKYSQVMHIVSQVEGKLAKDKNAADVIRATFPAGTVSGAPKIQAIQTISRIEKEPRGFYAGLVGYFDANGDIDTCITIRSGVKKGDLLYLQAGGGIVFDSTPERELEETNEKLRATALAAGIEV